MRLDKDMVRDIKGVLKLYHGAKSHKTPRRVQDLLTAMALIRSNPSAYDLNEDPADSIHWWEGGGESVCENCEFPGELVRELADVLEKPVAAKQLKKLSKTQLQAIATMVEEENDVSQGFMTLRPPKATEKDKTKPKNKSKGKSKDEDAAHDDAEEEEEENEEDNGDDSDVDDDGQGGGYSIFNGDEVRPNARRIRTALSEMSAAAPEASDPDHDIAAAAVEAFHNTPTAGKRRAQAMELMFSSMIFIGGLPRGLGPAPKRARR